MDDNQDSKRKPELPGGFVSMSDQLQAVYEEIARFVAAYYHGLIGAGVPGDLAGALTLEASKLILAKYLGPFPASSGVQG